MMLHNGKKAFYTVKSGEGKGGTTNEPERKNSMANNRPLLLDLVSYCNFTNFRCSFIFGLSVVIGFTEIKKTPKWEIYIV